MKILMINSVFNSGSTGRIIKDLQDKIQKTDNNIALVAYGRGKKQKNGIKISNNLDNVCHVIGTRLFDRHGFFSIITSLKLKKLLNIYKPDIIHIHNIHGYYINIKILFNEIKKREIPLVITLHDCWLFTGHCSYFDIIGCELWKTECCKCKQKGEYPKSFYIDNSKRNFNEKKEILNSIEKLTIVTPSLWLESIVKESFLNTFNVITIHNGIDIDMFRYRESNIKELYKLNGKKIVLGVANPWSKRKGLDYFIKLSELLPEYCNIVLIGLKKKEIKNITKRIIALEKTSSVEDLVKWYSAADVFVNPTLEDNFPTTNIEAMSCGTPVITFNTGGSPESIDIMTGKVVNKGDILLLNKAIIEIITEGKEKYFNNCRIWVEKYFNKKNNYEKYIHIYNNLYREHNCREEKYV
jgi:glycosyltransferase involved in cell wall biosynthesis